MYDPLDLRGVPVSRGVPMLVRVLVILGVIATFGVGWSVIHNAPYGHYWPSSKTLRVPLTNNGQ